MATAGMRDLPDFLIVGVKRGGTTSLYFDLIEHPAIARLYPPPMPGLKRIATKGVHYFDSNYTRGERWYRSYFPTNATRALIGRRTGVRTLTGEASPYYLFHPAAADRAYGLVPQAKIIALLRDPVQRTYSHWKERRRGNHEPLEFVEALAAEPQRLHGERERLLADPSYLSYAWEQQSYLTQSEYAGCVREWIDRFGADQVFIAASEDYYTDPVALLGDIDEFLGLPRRATSSGTIRNPAAGEPLDPELESRLRAEFAEDAAALRTMVSRPIPWLAVERDPT